jgi:hypothetical protein
MKPETKKLKMETREETIERLATYTIGIDPGSEIAIEYRGNTDHEFEPAVGVVGERGQFSIDGCFPGSPNMTGRILSRPWRYESIAHPIHIIAGGLDYVTMATTCVCVFADGSRIYEANHHGTIIWLTGQGEERANIPLLEAIARTPKQIDED